MHYVRVQINMQAVCLHPKQIQKGKNIEIDISQWMTVPSSEVIIRVFKGYQSFQLIAHILEA